VGILHRLMPLFCSTQPHRPYAAFLFHSAAQAEERAKAQATALAADAVGSAALKLQERATEALLRAKTAEGTIRRTKALPGIKGRLVRWLAGDVLK